MRCYLLKGETICLLLNMAFSTTSSWRSSLKRVLKRVTLESGLLLGGALFLAGFAGCARVSWRWAASGFGPLTQVRQVLFWSMWLFIGVQIIFASFFLSMLGISRGTYIGDYDLK